MRNVINTNMSSLWGSTGMSNLLGGSSSSSGSGMSILDYNTVNSVSYQKAIKAYYQQEKASSSADSETVASNKAEFASMRDAAADMKESAEALMNADLYKENEKGEIDRDGIVSAMKDFVKDYNAVVDKAGDSSDKATLRSGVWMTEMTGKNSGLLSEIGLTVGKDNKLSLSETTLRNARTSTLTSLLTGRDSFAGRISQRGSNFVAASERGLANGTYTKNGSYNKAAAASDATKLNEEV